MSGSFDTTFCTSQNISPIESIATNETENSEQLITAEKSSHYEIYSTQIPNEEIEISTGTTSKEKP